jgi:hypothetical protein
VVTTTLEDEVASLIRQNKPREICVDCVAVALKIRAREALRRITEGVLKSVDFELRRGSCSMCRNDREKPLIVAV